MPKISSGVLFYRLGHHGIEVLLVHPGGPFWKNKDQGAWSIPKGEVEEERGETLLAAALREAQEELGPGTIRAVGKLIALPAVKQKSGKIVRAWLCPGEGDPAKLRSNVFTLEWPPKSGRMSEFPEVDRAAWFSLPGARERIHPAQIPFLDAAEKHLGGEAYVPPG
jgi:predicted NUDIX family NTP pyrophosphohydrolase